jgi:hypothetical protein
MYSIETGTISYSQELPANPEYIMPYDETKLLVVGSSYTDVIVFFYNMFTEECVLIAQGTSSDPDMIACSVPYLTKSGNKEHMLYSEIPFSMQGGELSTIHTYTGGAYCKAPTNLFKVYSSVVVSNTLFFAGLKEPHENILLPGLTEIENNSSINIPCKIYISGTGEFHYIENGSTGHRMYFNNLDLSNDTVLINTQEGTITSSAGESLLNTLVPGSDLATFRLIPGTNYINTFADTTLVVQIQWQNKYNSGRIAED